MNRISRATSFQTTLALVVLFAETTSGCLSMQEHPTPLGLGYSQSTSRELASMQGPVDALDLKQVSQRARRLYTMERMMGLAYQKGLLRSGQTSAEMLIPIAEIDPGDRSAQVVFYRWFKADLREDGSFDPKKAHRWLVVPMLLLPDRVLEVEQFNNLIEIDGDAHRKLVAIQMAVKSAMEKFPKGNWRVHALREQVSQGGYGAKLTRVYLFAVDASVDADLEVIVADEKGREEAKVLQVQLHLKAGQWSAAIPHIELMQPSVMTVARVLARNALAQRFDVEAADGSQWRIDGETGEIRRAETEGP